MCRVWKCLPGGRLESEMRRYGSLDQVQMIAKHNCYLFVYANESYASAAAAALSGKAHLVWGISKVRISTKLVHDSAVYMRYIAVSCFVKDSWHAVARFESLLLCLHCQPEQKQGYRNK